MTELDFIEFISKYPVQIENKLRELIYQYQDPLTLFLLESIDKIDYFRGVSEKTKRDIVYSMNPINYDKD